MEALVSIILPVYNGEEFLEQSINSILSQTYKEFELIIVNDCSTDSSESIIQKYLTLDKRIRYFKNKKNYKLPRSLNVGFAEAKGKYFTWTSDDNIFHKTAIETMVDYLEEHSEIQLVYCDYNEIDEKGKTIKTICVEQPEQLIYKNVVGACFLYRESIAKKVGNYIQERFLVEDYDYWLRIYLSGKIAPLHKCLYDYRIHQRSLTSRQKEEIRNALKKLQYYYLREYEKKGFSNKFLFDYLEWILQTERDRNTRILVRLNFMMRHPLYVIYIFFRKRRSYV